MRTETSYMYKSRIDGKLMQK